MSLNDRVCRCGHAADAHEHHRFGTECACCGCVAFHRASRKTSRHLALAFSADAEVLVLANSLRALPRLQAVQTIPQPTADVCRAVPPLTR